MSTLVRNVVFEAPDPLALAEFYAGLLALDVLRRPPDWMVVGREGEFPRLAFDPAAADWVAPRWPDPAYPQQLHLHLAVPDRAATEKWLYGHGATRLPDLGGDAPVWSDPAGHPFCLFEAPDQDPQVAAVVSDSADAASLGEFYTGLLELTPPDRTAPARVTLDAPEPPALEFVHVPEHRPPEWPDHTHPQQLHLDLQVSDQDAEVARALDTGASRLPAMGGDAPVLADPAGHPFCVCPRYLPMIKKACTDAWGTWRATTEAIDPDLTRIPGVCGEWTVHDVVGHVQARARFRLAHLRGAFEGRAPEPAERDGARRPWPEGVENTVDARNEAIRVAGLGLTWQQLLDEANCIEAQTLAFLDQLGERLLDARAGWVPLWEPAFANAPNHIDGLMVRRVRDVPTATDPMPAWRFVQPDEPDGHMSEHLEQIRNWLAARTG